jgi:hypothetical protein
MPITIASYVNNKQGGGGRNSMNKQFIRGKGFNVHSVSTKHNTKMSLLFIRKLYIWVKNSNVKSVITRQVTKVALLLIQKLVYIGRKLLFQKCEYPGTKMGTQGGIKFFAS